MEVITFESEAYKTLISKLNAIEERINEKEKQTNELQSPKGLQPLRGYFTCLMI